MRYESAEKQLFNEFFGERKLTGTTPVVDSNHRAKVNAYWSARTLSTNTRNLNWWSQPTIVREINRRICGRPVSGTGNGVIELARNCLEGRPARRGISIGCGTGIKELRLLASGIVETMICFDLSEGRIAEARAEATRRELTDRATFLCADAFADPPKDIDLVYWNNALHHMPDVNAALAFSRSLLKGGGLLVLDDYVGPNAIQFTHEMLAFASEVRSHLPERYLTRVEGGLFSRTCAPPDKGRLLAKDPSEAMDSESILAALARHFPECQPKLTGGVVYFVALNGLCGNFRSGDPEDDALLNYLMMIDELWTGKDASRTLYMATAGRVEPHGRPKGRRSTEGQLNVRKHE